MSAVGFHTGNESCVVAIAKDTGIVCIHEEQCFLGIADDIMSMSYPKDTIPQIIRLIGRSFSDPDLQHDLKTFPLSVTEGPDGFPLIRASYRGETLSFTPTEVMGMMFSNMKKLAEKNLNELVMDCSFRRTVYYPPAHQIRDVVDCCIGIPVYFTDLQRRAVIDAAIIAGLNPLRLIHETTATALAYGLYKTELPENEPINVAFVDIGHASMQVCIAGFKKGELEILAHSFDRCLGGKDFDEVLFNHFAEKFKSDYKIDVFQNEFASNPLQSACEKLKKVLRSNPEAPLYIEYFMDKKYVRGFIQRDEFEQISSLLLERVKKLLEKAISDAGVTVDDIDALEVVGSDSWVIKILTQFMGKQPRGTMNASECVSKGCALQCAILSPDYKVREFQVQESFPIPIALQSEKTENLESCIIFPSGNRIPSVKSWTLYRSCTFNLDVQYADARELQAPPKIGTFMIGPFQSTNGERCKVEVKVHLNLHGCVSVESAQRFEEEGIVVQIPVSRIEPPKETTKIVEKGLTDAEVYECTTLPKT